DLHVEVPAVDVADLGLPPAAESSADVATRVAAARDIQARRLDAEAPGQGLRTNAQADGALLERIAAPDQGGRALLMEAAEKMRLTARGYHRVLRVARTLADLEGVDGVKRIHIAEAVATRRPAMAR
ncbi:MAG: ATP-binding protein, partial [Alphaproteobacteria bacterium]